MSRRAIIVLFSCLFVSINAITYYGICAYSTNFKKMDTLYLLQTGIFNNEDNLNNKVKQLEKHNITAYVVETNDNYIVYSAIASFEEQLTDLKTKLEKCNISYIIKKVEFNDPILKDAMSKKDYQTIIEKMRKGGVLNEVSINE